MYYETESNEHGLRHDPFKALIVPRPIGWVSTTSDDGVHNLAPFSFFNGVSDRPPMIMFSCANRNDTLNNIEKNGECTVSMASLALRDQMNLSSAPVAAQVSEFDIASLAMAPSQQVRPPRVADSPAAFECRLWQVIALPGTARRPDRHYSLVVACVVGIYINDAFVHDGLVDTGAMQPLARLGYMQYSVLETDSIFSLNRPTVSDDGRQAILQPGEWSGVYR
ncbi:MAG: flavin reductase family protein [Burkholderiaceae bacterium]